MVFEHVFFLRDVRRTMDGRLGRRPYIVRAFQRGKKFLTVCTVVVVVLYSYSWKVTSSFICAVRVFCVAATPPSVRVVVLALRLRYRNFPRDRARAVG